MSAPEWALFGAGLCSANSNIHTGSRETSSIMTETGSRVFCTGLGLVRKAPVSSFCARMRLLCFTGRQARSSVPALPMSREVPLQDR
jgi:hypothetical protein